MKLTEHFTLEELTASSTGTRLSIRNAPDDQIKARLLVLANGLEKVRELLGDNAVHIDSGYRCPELNKAVKGSDNSAHMLGFAADFVCPAFGSPVEIVRAIAKSGLEFDQCIQEGTWVHISFDTQMRRSLMIAKFCAGKPTKYVLGVA